MDRQVICFTYRPPQPFIGNNFPNRAMAYKPILQASLKDEPRDFLPGTYGNYSRTQSSDICTGEGKEHHNLQLGQFLSTKLKITIFQCFVFVSDRLPMASTHCEECQRLIFYTVIKVNKSQCSEVPRGRLF